MKALEAENAALRAEVERLKVDPGERPVFNEKISQLQADLAAANAEILSLRERVLDANLQIGLRMKMSEYRVPLWIYYLGVFLSFIAGFCAKGLIK